jgi:hypothetical protein
MRNFLIAAFYLRKPLNAHATGLIKTTQKSAVPVHNLFFIYWQESFPNFE